MLGLLVGGFALASLMAGPLELPPMPLDRFVWFTTTFPPVNNVVFEWKPNYHAPPTLYQFRFQPSAFFARIATAQADFETPLSEDQEAAGNWESDYWYLVPQGPGRPSELHTCSQAPPDDWSNAKAGNVKFLRVFSWFATFGISELGPGSVVAGQETPLELVVDPAQAPFARLARTGDPLAPASRHPVSLELSNGVPVQASLRRLSANGVPLDLKIAYGYDTNIAPLGIPSEITMGPVRGRLLKLEWGNPQEPLPKASFLPPETIRTNLQLTHLVRSNRHDYLLRAGQMIRTDLPEEVALAALRGEYPKNRQFYLRAVLFCSLLLAPVLVALGRKYARKRK